MSANTKHSNRTLSTLACAALALALTACGGNGDPQPTRGPITGGDGSVPPPPTCTDNGHSCSKNGDCCSYNEGHGFCVSGVCADSCVGGWECKSGYCAPLEGGGGACMPRPDDVCSEAGDPCGAGCCSGNVCVSNTNLCHGKCYGHSDCNSSCCIALEGVAYGACFPSAFCM